MPWSGTEFAQRHNRKLKGEAASDAAKQANALLGEGLPEGEAIAIANKNADRRADKRYGSQSKDKAGV